MSEHESVPQPSTTKIEVPQVYRWYEGLKGRNPALVSANDQKLTSTNGAIKLKWNEALVDSYGSEELVIVPIEDNQKLFEVSEYQGYRYLIAGRKNGSLYGLIVEMLYKKKVAPKFNREKVLREAFLQKNKFFHIEGFEGFLLFYTVEYKYIEGVVYKENFVSSKARLSVQKNSARAVNTTATLRRGMGVYQSCTDWFNGSDGSYITSTCTYETIPDPDGGNWENPPIGPGDWGGGPINPNGEGGADPTSPAPIKQVIVKIYTSNVRECLNKVIRNLQMMSTENNNFQGGAIAELIRKINSDNSKINIAFEEKDKNEFDSNDVIADANFLKEENGYSNYVIRINTSYLESGEGKGATELGIAQAVVHEIMHVYMMDWYKQKYGDGLIPKFNLIMDLWFDTRKTLMGDGIAQHEMMVPFIDNIKEALQAYYYSSGVPRRYSFSPSFAESLAWGGLQNTQAYKDRIAQDKNFGISTDAILEAEFHNRWVSKYLIDGTGITYEPQGTMICP